MTRTKRLAATLCTGATAATLFTASPALAQSAPPPPPPGTTVATFCPAGTVPGGLQPDGSLLFGVEANGAGCVVVRSIPEGLALVEVVVAPGWDWVFGGGGGGRQGQGAISGKVDIRFENAATGDKVEVRIEPGKTEVK
jgi:hypothetical protein